MSSLFSDIKWPHPLPDISSDSHNDFVDSMAMFPVIKKVYAKTVKIPDEWDVYDENDKHVETVGGLTPEPLSPPTGKLYFMDIYNI
jgi:hypothetical protein